MVWIHGGGFVSGSGTPGLYGPEHFMDRDVVLVTLNYRLSVLGGLYLGEECPGNQGMRDQILGLQWVQENIKQFGGAPDRVTIFGESAGGMSVMNHVLSPRSAGLFSAAIAMSGSPLSPFTGADKHPRHYAVRLAARLGCTARSDQEILQFLQRQQPEQLQSLGYMFEEFIRAPFPFKPIVDGGLVSDPVLPAEPLQLLQSGQYNKVPLIVGTNRDEGLLIKGFYDREEEGYATAWRDWDTVGPLAFFHRERDEVGEAEVEASRRYRDKHWSDGQKFGASGQGGEALVRMYGDLLFTAPADWLVKLVAGGPDPPPVYHYLYSHQGPVSLYDILGRSPLSHALNTAPQCCLPGSWGCSCSDSPSVSTSSPRGPGSATGTSSSSSSRRRCCPSTQCAPGRTAECRPLCWTGGLSLRPDTSRARAGRGSTRPPRATWRSAARGRAWSTRPTTRPGWRSGGISGTRCRPTCDIQPAAPGKPCNTDCTTRLQDDIDTRLTTFPVVWTNESYI